MCVFSFFETTTDDFYRRRNLCTTQEAVVSTRMIITYRLVVLALVFGGSTWCVTFMLASPACVFLVGIFGCKCSFYVELLERFALP